MRVSDTSRTVASAAGTGKTENRPEPARHVFGPRPIGALISGLTRPAFRRRSPAVAQLLADWPAIVGPALAAVTLPRRLSAATLTIACAGPVALELQHLAGEVAARINAHFGHALVTRLRFVQETVALAPVPLPAVPPPPDERAERAVAALPAGALRDALASLGRAVLATNSTPASRQR